MKPVLARLVAASTLLLCLIGGSVAPAVAASTGEATSQQNFEFWWGEYGIDQAHTAGLTGKGVKVAVLEKQINPDLPVFQGTNLHVSASPVCVNKPAVTTTDANDASIHGTTMAAYIVGNGTGAGAVRGIAPDADLTFYGYGPDDGPQCETADGNKLTAFGAGVKMAVDDGAKIIYTAIGGSARKDDAPAIAYALARGAVIVSASINPRQLGAREGDQGAYNGVVSTAAVDRDGNLQQLDGAPFVIPQTTVVAAGFRLPAVGKSGDWQTGGTGTGSSFASPIVAGMLALASQKTPDASANQLLQALISTTNGGQHTPSRTDDGYGYGAAWLSTLLAVDPLTLPDSNPLMDKAFGFGAPTAEQIATAQANGYSPEKRPSSADQLLEQNGSAASGTSLLDVSTIVLWVVVGLVAIVVVAIVVTVLIISSQRRKARKEQAA
ncbi:S8 family peptidase [Microbacterium testaceum]|uniref:S8 family peptidase n=1 Tax=Microbacterium testaceum TaxID=2033 RepID=UPI002434CF4A|nr:S8 family serine peptidase [Microbacterium testaceum]